VKLIVESLQFVDEIMKKILRPPSPCSEKLVFEPPDTLADHAIAIYG